MPECLPPCQRCGAIPIARSADSLCTACLLEKGLAGAERPEEQDAEATRIPHFGDYDLLEEIARGGMGIVFKARQRSLNRIVAVKMILHGDLASELEVQRFLSEARAAATLQHPHIVAIHEVGSSAGRHFFSMDYVEGGNLAQLARDGQLTPTQAAQCVETIAGAVHYAHGRGILHRDLKPSNVLVDRQGQLHITDFGLAKRLDLISDDPNPGTDSAFTLTGEVLGSPNFMPPEQAAGRHRELTPAADIYSLGALLYHLLTGRPPFLADSIPATLRLVAEAEPVAPRLLSPGVPRDLETICLKCLEKDPRRRYGTAEELADELKRFRRDEPIHARPTGPGEKLRRWTRRHPALALLVGGIGPLLFAVAIISTVAATRLRRANREGQEKLREAYLANARANRWSGRPGRRFESLDALANAANLRPGVDLRNEAIAAMALVDLHPAKSWELPPGSIFEVDASYEHYMRGTTNGPLTLYQLTNDQPLARHDLVVVPPFQWAGLSGCSRYFLIFSGTPKTPSFEIFRWGSPLPIFRMTNAFMRTFAFSRDERQVALGVTAIDEMETNRVLIVDLSNGTTNLDFVPHTRPGIAFNAAADQLAVFGTASSKLEIRAVPSGRLLQTLPHDDGIFSANWSNDGRQLAVANADSYIYVWNLTKPPPRAVRLQQGGVATTVSFSPDDELLASRGWNDQLRLWDTRTGRELLRQANVRLGGFSPNGNHLIAWSATHRADLCEVARAREFRWLQTGRTLDCSFSADGQLLATAHEDGIRFWEAVSGQEIGLIPELKITTVSFARQGPALLMGGSSGLRHYSRRPGEAGATNTLLFTKHPLLCDGRALARLSLDQSGRRVAVSRDGWLEVYDNETGKSLFTRDRQRHIVGAFGGISLSPRGDWVAAAEINGGSAHVWEMASTDKGHDLAPDATLVTFSPDGRWLVTGTTMEYVVWQVPTWKARRRFARPLNAGVHPNAVFSPDSRSVALKLTERTIGLWEVESGQHLATFEPPGDTRLGFCAFNPKGDRMAVADLDSGGILLWDLQAIRQRLSALNLDWNSPAYTASDIPALEAPRRWHLEVTNAPPPARAAQCTPRQIDLSAHYNATFSNLNRITGDADNDLSDLPIGLQSMGGIEFDVRGVIQLGLRRDGTAPATAKDMEIRQSCRSLHFLHSAINLRLASGDLAAQYVIHWADGETVRVPVKNHVNIGDWWHFHPRPLDTNTTVSAWLGKNVASSRVHNQIQLYKFRWDNPRPQVPVATVDFETVNAEPFLIAITAE